MSARWWTRSRQHARHEDTTRWDTIEFKLD